MTRDSETVSLSPAAAAKIAGCSRTVINRAIASKILIAQRNNRNQWQIDRVDLDAWIASRSLKHEVTRASETVSVELAAAQAKIAALEASLEATKDERDRLAALLSEAIKTRRSWWRRVLG